MAPKQGEALLPYIYHGSMLCAQHALNGVLQGHFFDPSQLSQIAAELAEYEQSELGIDHTDLAASDTAQHMDDTGYFSIEVLDRAFKTWDMSLVRWRKQSLQQRHEHPEREFAFVLNLGSHWLAVRGFNLNSFFAKPQWLGEAYLGTFLHAAEQEGYSVFVVEHEGVAPPDNIADDVADAGDENGTQQEPISISDDEDPELQEALRLSREEYAGNGDVQSLTPRRRRTREPTSGSEEENDGHVDAIAPTRNRSRNDDLVESLPVSGHRSRRRSQAHEAMQDTSTDLQGLRASRSRRNSRRQSSPDVFDDEESNVRQSPFLHAVATSSLLNEDVQEIDELSDSDIEEVPRPAPAPQLSEDDEQLQAVIAASLGQPYEVPERLLSHANRELNTRPASQPIPEDVERIRRMRESANQPTPPPAPELAPEPAPEAPEEEEDEDEEEEQVSPEEMRRRRLARFG